MNEIIIVAPTLLLSQFNKAWENYFLFLITTATVIKLIHQNTNIICPPLVPKSVSLTVNIKVTLSKTEPFSASTLRNNDSQPPLSSLFLLNTVQTDPRTVNRSPHDQPCTHHALKKENSQHIRTEWWNSYITRSKIKTSSWENGLIIYNVVYR